MNNKELFLQAINNKNIVKIKVDSKSKGMILRHCIPFDFWKSKRKWVEYWESKFHFWDLDSPDKVHNLSVLPERLLEIELTDKTFNPSNYVLWKPIKWNIKRDWGIYS